MTLIETLNTLDPNTIICLGSDHSFFDINRAGYMRDKKYLENLSILWKKKFEKSANMHRDKVLTRMQSPIVKISDDSKNLEWATPENLLDMLEGRMTIIENDIQEYKNAQELVDNFIGLAEREVVNLDPKIRDAIDGATVIIVSGDEEGPYWFISDIYKDGQVPEWKEDN